MAGIFWSVALHRSFCKMRRSVNKEVLWSRWGGGFTIVSSYMETAIINGAIRMLQNLVLLANHCLQLDMVSNASCMRRSGVVLCSVDGIRRRGRQGEDAILPVGVTHPLANWLYLWRLWVCWIDVVTMKLSGRNRLVSGTPSVLLPNS